MRRLITFSLVLLTRIVATGQNTIADRVLTSSHKEKKVELSMLTGFNQGKYTFADIGLELNKSGETGIHSFSTSYSISNELKLGRGRTVIGPKMGLWIAGGPALGLNLIYYTDFEKSCIAVRPELGFGVTNFKLVYGYNWLLTNNLNGLNRSLIGLMYCFKFDRSRKEP